LAASEDNYLAWRAERRQPSGTMRLVTADARQTIGIVRTSYRMPLADALLQMFVEEFESRTFDLSFDFRRRFSEAMIATLNGHQFGLNV